MSQSVYIETYGCSLNAADGELMAGLLSEAGYRIVATPDDAHLIVLNSCTVKGETFRNFEKRLRELAARPLVVAGCIPKVYQYSALLNRHSYIGTDNISQIVEAVSATLAGKRFQRLEGHDKKRLNLPRIRRNAIVEILPICKGCLGRCAYCQTRLARGELVSYPEDEIVLQARCALEEGVKEFWLTAQDTGAYGHDIGTSIVSLLRRLRNLPGDFSIRLGMANPNHIVNMLDDLVEIFKNDKIYKFLHVPVQSGSDRILRAMNRAYRVADFVRICEEFRRAFPYATIATDVIVGFPGETDQDFEETLALLREIKPATINRSRFSPRPGTPAASLPSVPAKIVSQRSHGLTELVKELTLANNLSWVGWEGEVLVGEQRKAGSWLARNMAYKPLVIPQSQDGKSNPEQIEDLQPGNRVHVRITRATTFHLVAQREN
jgi:threonylcarbamoyladenosine tRNA methylthiotransferase CDKAL1